MRTLSNVSPTNSTQLLAIVEVPPEEKVLCGQPGCGHGVWKAVHVVLDQGVLLVLGSTCFEKRYGSRLALGAPSYGGGVGRRLTPEERVLLVENTAAFVARMESEVRLHAESLARAHAEAVAAAAEVLRARKAHYEAQPRMPDLAKPKASPWPWMKPLSSLGYFKLRDGSSWVRVQRKDGQQVLAPWPVVNGWDEALPAHIGPADLEVGGYLLRDVRETVAYLEELGGHCRVFGSWRELVAGAAR